ncbi:MAG: glycosyl hydrolase family 28 protein [Eubacteriales bacterium]|nr:glycosyl hydrolase family 28 protein [Eubacteriales bacterium]
MAIYDVRAFGAVGDGIQDDTAALQAAIDACADGSGGRVSLAGGCFVTGTLYLKSGVFLEIEASAKLLASPRIGDYGTDTHHNRYRNEPELDRCLIFAADAENIGLTGYGQINGNGEAFPNAGTKNRPMLIRFLRCKNVHVENLQLYDAAAWTTAFLDCEAAWVRGVDICNEKRYNGDGLDFDGCSRVWVSDCRIRGTDDNLCLQSSGRPTENVHITNCMFSSVCAGIRIGLKSVGDIRDVVIANCTMRDVWREGIKIECSEGGTISDILISQVVMRNVRRPLFMILNNRFVPEGFGSSLELSGMPAIGRMERISVNGLTAVDETCMEQTQYRFDDDIMGEPRFGGFRVDAAAGHPIRELTLSHIRYECVGGVRLTEIPERYPEVVDQTKVSEADCTAGVSENYWPDWSRTACMDIRHVDGLCLEQVHCSCRNADQRPMVLVEGCTRVTGQAETRQEKTGEKEE